MNYVLFRQFYDESAGNNSLENSITRTYKYSSIGNITNKSDIGHYRYGEGNAGPHAVTSAGIYSFDYG